jgi:hypothetical protein
MDAREAREQLEMVDRILANAEPERVWRPYPRLLVLIGIGAALIDAGTQAGSRGEGPAMAIAGVVLIVGSWIYLTWATIQARRTASRMSISQARMGSAIQSVWLAVIVAAFAQPHLFSGWSSAAIWSLGAAIQMFIVGFAGDRRALLSGLVLLASMIVANYMPGAEGYTLAGGFVFGYVVPGVLYMLDKDPSADCG